MFSGQKRPSQARRPWKFSKNKTTPEGMAICRLHEKPNAKVNRQKCEAFLSALNRQLGFSRKA